MLYRELIVTEPFDVNEALKAVQSGQAISGKDSVLAPLLKQLSEATLSAILSRFTMSFTPLIRLKQYALSSAN